MCLFISLLNIIQNIHESDYDFHVKFTRFTNKTKGLLVEHQKHYFSYSQF